MLKQNHRIKKLIFTITRLVLLLIIVLPATAILCRCQGVSKQEENRQIIDNHINNSVLHDILFIYKDKYGHFPEQLGELQTLYEDGDTSFGLDSKSISVYIKDPFSEKYFAYSLIDENSFIIYSVGPDGNDDNQANIARFIDGTNSDISFEKYNIKDSSGDLLIYLVSNGELVEY